MSYAITINNDDITTPFFLQEDIILTTDAINGTNISLEQGNDNDDDDSNDNDGILANLFALESPHFPLDSSPSSLLSTPPSSLPYTPLSLEYSPDHQRQKEPEKEQEGIELDWQGCTDTNPGPRPFSHLYQSATEAGHCHYTDDLLIDTEDSSTTNLGILFQQNDVEAPPPSVSTDVIWGSQLAAAGVIVDRRGEARVSLVDDAVLEQIEEEKEQELVQQQEREHSHDSEDLNFCSSHDDDFDFFRPENLPKYHFQDEHNQYPSVFRCAQSPSTPSPPPPYTPWYGTNSLGLYLEANATRPCNNPSSSDWLDTRTGKKDTVPNSVLKKEKLEAKTKWQFSNINSGQSRIKNACTSCKDLKVKCSGGLPCIKCAEAEARGGKPGLCRYEPLRKRGPGKKNKRERQEEEEGEDAFREEKGTAKKQKKRK